MDCQDLNHISDFRITFVVGQNLDLIYDVTNLGKYPINIQRTKFGFRASEDVPDFNKELNNMKGNLTNTYVLREPVYTGTWDTGRILTENEYEMITSKKRSFYWYGEIQYKNPANGKRWKYVYAFRITHPEKPREKTRSNEFQIIKNEYIPLN